MLPERCGSAGPGSCPRPCPGARGAGRRTACPAVAWGTCRRGRGDSGRRRGELQVPGLRDPAGWGAPGTATRCHPRQVTASPLPGSWQLRPSRLRGQLSACPQAERSHRERLHPVPPRPRRDARSAARHRLAQGHPAGGWQRGDASPSPPAAAWRGCPSLPVPEICSCVIPPPNFAPAPNLSPSSPPDVPAGGQWATDGCLCHGQRCLAGWKLPRQSSSCRIWGDRPPVPAPQTPCSPAAGAPVTWEFSHVTGGGCAVAPGAVGCWGCTHLCRHPGTACFPGCSPLSRISRPWC